MTSASSMLKAGHSKQGTQSRCAETTQRDWVGEGGGRRVQDGGHMYTCGLFISVYGKNHHNFVIIYQLK